MPQQVGSPRMERIPCYGASCSQQGCVSVKAVFSCQWSLCALQSSSRARSLDGCLLVCICSSVL